MPVKRSFQPEVVSIATVAIVPIKTVSVAYRKTETYRRIAASIAHVGVIEPLVVFPTPGGTYLLLDGHTRLDVLVTMGVEAVSCILATDNESYTYNKRVNYIPPIAQHYMILRALAHVSEERIAAALNVTVAAIRGKRDLLKGICTEAVELLRNERVSRDAFSALRRMKPVRQIDVARLMISARKFSGHFAKALLDGTREEFLADKPPARRRDIAPERKTMMEQETDELLKHADSIKAHYGEDVLDLTTACKYVGRLLANSRIRRYLTKNHEDTFAALEQLIADNASDKARRLPKPPTRRPAVTATSRRQRAADGLSG